jgi:hypothetical protein
MRTLKTVVLVILSLFLFVALSFVGGKFICGDWPGEFYAHPDPDPVSAPIDPESLIYRSSPAPTRPALSPTATPAPEPVQPAKRSEPAVEATTATTANTVSTPVVQSAVAVADATPIQRLQSDSLYQALSREQKLAALQALVDQAAADAGCRTYAIKVVPDSEMPKSWVAFASPLARTISIRESDFSAAANSAYARWDLVLTVIHEAAHMVQAEYVFGHGNGEFLNDTAIYGTDPDAAMAQIKLDMQAEPAHVLDSAGHLAHSAKFNEKAADATAFKFLERHMPSGAGTINYGTRKLDKPW